MKEKTHRLFPDTFAKIKRAKAEGIQAKTVWLTMQNGVKHSGMAPSGQAAALATYAEYIAEVYGKRATAFLRKEIGK